jgi:hypothetical protein
MTGTLRQAAAGYLQIRQSLGYQLQAHGRLLMSYIADLEASGQTTVTAALGITGLAQPTPVGRAVLRSLPQRTDPSCQVPPAWLLSARYSRFAPYIYIQQQIDALVHAAGTLAASCRVLPGGDQPACHHRRIGEAIALTRADTDLGGGIITVVNGKHGASRHVPLHPLVTRMLRRYAGRRDRLCPAHLRRNDHPGLVPRRRGRPSPAADAVHHARPHRAGAYLLVPDRCPRPVGACSPVAARPPRRPAMTAIAPIMQAFFTDRLMNQLPRQPPHDHQLPRHDAAAARLRPPAARQGTLRAGLHRPRRADGRRVPHQPRRRSRQDMPIHSRHARHTPRSSALGQHGQFTSKFTS